MPLFACSKCGCVENTALSKFWMSQLAAYEAKQPHQPLCSQCDPEIGKWHGIFPRQRAEGYVTDRSGYIYTQARAANYFKGRGPFKPVVLPPGKSEPAGIQAPGNEKLRRVNAP